jgi:hypothetical protein
MCCLKRELVERLPDPLDVHYTDLTPAVVFLAVTNNGNNPFYRFPTSSTAKMTQFHAGAFAEVMTAYGGDFLSDIYVGWAQCLHFKACTRLVHRVKWKIRLGPLSEG